MGESFTCECGATHRIGHHADLWHCVACDRWYSVRWSMDVRSLRQCANLRCQKMFAVEDPRQRYCTPACSARVRQQRVRQKVSG